ncbi:MAG: DMT family transporter [Planctomycetota bacterium]
MPINDPSKPTDDRPPSPWVGLVTIVLTLAGWTAAPLLIREFTTDVDPWTSNGWRYGFAAVLWAPWLLWQASRGGIPEGLWKAALVPAFINAAAQVAFTKAHYLIEPALLTFGLRMQIVCVTVGAALLFPVERAIIRRPLFLVGIGLVLVGTLTTAGLQPGITEGASATGVGLAMAAGAGYAMYALAVRWFFHGTNPMTAFAAISQITAFCMVGLMIPFGERSGLTALDMAPGRFGLFFLSAVVGIAAGHVLYYISIARLGVTVSSGVVQTQPFTVGAASYALFGEVLRPLQWVSGSVAVGGAILMLVVQHRSKPVTRSNEPAKPEGGDAEAEATRGESDSPGAVDASRPGTTRA